jgi:predicted ATPase
VHDHIQQAAYSLMADARKITSHYRIGQLLLQNSAAEERGRKIFDIVDHLNLGKDIVSQPAERTRLAGLNLTAGTKAKTSAAYQAAFSYLRSGIGLLHDRAWQDDYDLTLQLYT